MSFSRMFVFLCLCLVHGNVWGQHMTTVSLDGMTAFKPQSGNWSVVGNVTMDPYTDIHQHENVVPETKGNRKKKKPEPQPAPPQAVTYTPGTGILLNMNSETAKDNLVTNVEHGDIELELELMIPRGSNSGIFLQGRYEVQLFDSWGVKNPGFSDIGGIYRNWETEPSKIYMGKAPLKNAAKAPGLWQKMKILFRAPKFNEQGEKIANAMFESVELNGVLIHDHVEVPKLTGAPIEPNEKPFGPLLIQGDHGPVAFRNIRYRLLHESDVSLSDLSYKVFKGQFEVMSDFLNDTPEVTGTTNGLSWEVAGIEDGFAIVYNGTIEIPEDDQYTFQLRLNGNGQMKINGEVNPEGWGNKMLISNLKKGAYPIEIIYYKNVNWQPPKLGLLVQGWSTHAKALHTFSSMPPDGDLVAPIYLEPTEGAKLHRAFLDFESRRDQRLTHTIAVGEPVGIHYAYDLASGSLVTVWRGDFVDATPMWHERGDGSFEPRGVVQWLTMRPPLATLASGDAPFPADNGSTFTSTGYVLEDNRPVFLYTYKGISVTDKITPDVEGKFLRREIKFENQDTTGLYFKLADGNGIEQMPDGSYAIGEKEYLIKIESGEKPVVRDQPHGVQELLMPVSGKAITYTIVW